MNDLIQIEPEYIYVTIPAEYICVYHRILIMLADYGEDMLKDCKASCSDRNSNVIECFNMFNAAVAARKLGKTKLAETLIKYIKAKINQIYRGKDNSTSFVFPVDEIGQLKAFVSCGERPRFEINPDDGELYEHRVNNGFSEHFKLGSEDGYDDDHDSSPVEKIGLVVVFTPRWEVIDNVTHACCDINVFYNGDEVSIENVTYTCYYDGIQVDRFLDVTNPSEEIHNFTVVVAYNGKLNVETKYLKYGDSN